jgi:phosphonate transport system substrate-binding protein
MNKPPNISLMAICSAILTLMIIFAFGCNKGPQSQGPKYGTEPLTQNITIYNLAVHPLHNPSKMIRAYQPLINHLNNLAKDIGFHLEASRDYANYEAKFRAREPAFLLPNPWQTLEAMKAGYSVIAMAGDSNDFKGVFVVRQDSSIKEPSDLKGKAVSYPSRTALAACIMPQYFLHDHGIDVNKDIDNKYVGSQESSIMNAYFKQTAVAATWPTPWRAFQKEHPAEASEMKLIWETPSLINNSIMARDNVPISVRERVREFLLNLHTIPEGRVILDGMEIARFYPASDSDYKIVRDYIARFEKEVRQVESK